MLSEKKLIENLPQAEIEINVKYLLIYYKAYKKNSIKLFFSIYCLDKFVSEMFVT